jgi:hypothetical protein
MEAACKSFRRRFIGAMNAALLTAQTKRRKPARMGFASGLIPPMTPQQKHRKSQ